MNLRMLPLWTLLLMTGVASAGEGEDALARGLRLFNVGDLKPAEKVFAKAVTLLPKGSDRAKAYLHLGLAKAYQEKFGSAKRDFVRALTEDALVTIDRERVPPPVRDAFDEARSTVTGTVVLGKGPDGASVEIDGQAKGGLPQSQALVVGEHTVRVIGEDGKELVKEKVVVRAGERHEVALPEQIVAVAPIAPDKPLPAAKPVVLKPVVESSAASAEPVVPPPDPEVVRQPLASLPPLPKDPLALVADELKASDSGGSDSGDSWFTPRRIAGVFTLSAGVALGFMGLGYGLAAQGAEREFRDARAQANFQTVLLLQQEAQDRARNSNILFGVGAGLVAAGLVVTLWPGGADRPSARLVPTAGGALLAMEF